MESIRKQIAAELKNHPIRATARETGIDPATLSRLVNGHRLCSGEIVDTLAAYFGMRLTTTSTRTRKPSARTQRSSKAGVG